jgi:hypothetical protein
MSKSQDLMQTMIPTSDIFYSDIKSPNLSLIVYLSSKAQTRHLQVDLRHRSTHFTQKKNFHATYLPAEGNYNPICLGKNSKKVTGSRARLFSSPRF